MAQVHVCNTEKHEPFQGFQDNTIRYVRVPESEEAQCRLYVQVEEPGQLRIESDGRELFQSAVDPSADTVPLASILNLIQRQPQAQSLLLGLTSRLGARHRKITTFRVIITKGDASVAATFNFQLLSPEAYEAKYTEHLTRLRRQQNHGFIVDWQIPPQQTCWNCHASVDGPTCSACGSDQE